MKTISLDGIQKILGDIQRVGWHVTGVFAQKNEKGPEWAFSIGLFYSFRHPEVIVFGLPYERCMDVVNVIGQEVHAGKRYEPRGEYPDILQDPYRCVFREVNRHHYSDYVGHALWFYEDDPFPLMQCFGPDKKGLFPWDDGCNDYVKNAQPFALWAVDLKATVDHLRVTYQRSAKPGVAAAACLGSAPIVVLAGFNKFVLFSIAYMLSGHTPNMLARIDEEILAQTYFAMIAAIFTPFLLIRFAQQFQKADPTGE